MVVPKEISYDTISKTIEQLDRITTSSYLSNATRVYKFFNVMTKPKLHYRNHDIYDSNNRFRGQLFESRNRNNGNYNYFYDYDSINDYL